MKDVKLQGSPERWEVIKKTRKIESVITFFFFSYFRVFFYKFPPQRRLEKNSLDTKADKTSSQQANIYERTDKLIFRGRFAPKRRSLYIVTVMILS